MKIPRHAALSRSSARPQRSSTPSYVCRPSTTALTAIVATTKTVKTLEPTNRAATFASEDGPLSLTHGSLPPRVGGPGSGSRPLRRLRAMGIPRTAEPPRAACPPRPVAPRRRPRGRARAPAGARRSLQRPLPAVRRRDRLSRPLLALPADDPARLDLRARPSGRRAPGAGGHRELLDVPPGVRVGPGGTLRARSSRSRRRSRRSVSSRSSRSSGERPG